MTPASVVILCVHEFYVIPVIFWHDMFDTEAPVGHNGLVAECLGPQQTSQTCKFIGGRSSGRCCPY